MPRYCHNPPSARRQMPQFAFKPTFEPLMLRHRAARRPKSPANTSKKCDPRDPGALRVGFSLILGLASSTMRFLPLLWNRFAMRYQIDGPANPRPLAWTAKIIPEVANISVIEQRLYETIKLHGRLPVPVKQREFRDGDQLLTVADFAYDNERIAIYCDGFAFHANRHPSSRRAKTKRVAGPRVGGSHLLGQDDLEAPRPLRGTNLANLLRAER